MQTPNSSPLTPHISIYSAPEHPELQHLRAGIPNEQLGVMHTHNSNALNSNIFIHQAFRVERWRADRLEGVNTGLK